MLGTPSKFQKHTYSSRSSSALLLPARRVRLDIHTLRVSAWIATCLARLVSMNERKLLEMEKCTPRQAQKQHIPQPLARHNSKQALVYSTTASAVCTADAVRMYTETGEMRKLSDVVHDWRWSCVTLAAGERSFTTGSGEAYTTAAGVQRALEECSPRRGLVPRQQRRLQTGIPR